MAYERHPSIGEPGDAPASRSRFADDELDETIGVVLAEIGFDRAIAFEFWAHDHIFSCGPLIAHVAARACAGSGRIVGMNRRSTSGACALVIAVVLAGCSASAATTGEPTTTPSASTSTPTSMTGRSVSIVTAPVKVAQTTDGSVGYREVGAGPPLVLIMGYSGSMDQWEPSFVDALGRTHRVVTFDNAGIGRTSALPAPLTISAMADQTAALIETLHLGRPDVLGWSMGGMIAQALAVKHPTEVRRLVLCATLPGNGKATLPSASAAEALGDPSKANAQTLLGLLFPANKHAALTEYVNQITQFPNFYLAPAAVSRAELGALGSWLGGKETAGQHIDEIASPTLVADGLEDELVPTANDRELARVVKGSSLALYPDSGHAFLFQDERVVLLRVQEFLAG
jgi:pimeloyl-ACP methyl ester carboxylesterase